MNSAILHLLTKKGKRLVMNTKHVTYTNGYSVDLLPYGKKLNADAAKAVRKNKGLDVVLGNLSLEAAVELSIQSAKLVVFKMYPPNSTEPMQTERVEEILRDRDKFAEWIVNEASKFQAELDDAWSVEAKN
jgi:hypothetical protein